MGTQAQGSGYAGLLECLLVRALVSSSLEGKDFLL